MLGCLATVAVDPIICLEDIHKSYGKGRATTPVLRGISLRVAPGDIVALVGQSGSGKSTLLNIIGGLDSADRGRVKVVGVDYRRAGEAELAALRNREIGFIFQSFHLLEHLSCLGNVMLPASFSRDSTDDAAALALAALERVGLAELRDRSPGELSGGQKQRVAIARALFHRPRLLLCDEPTGNLDSETGREVIEFFGELNERDGVTLLLVTHEERLSKFARSVVRIRDGVSVEDSPAARGAEPSP